MIISSILQSYIISKNLNIRPKYQRTIQWNLNQMNSFVDTIMSNGVTPSLWFYKYQEGDEKEDANHKFENIDGQHRMFVITNYRSGTFINDKGEMIFWDYKHGDEHHCIFYEENANTRIWAANNPDKIVKYMDETEKYDFDNYNIVVNVIHCKLLFEQRCVIFTSLQHGTPVRGSDLYKNFLHIPLIKWLMDNNFEKKYNEYIKNHLTVKHDKFWLEKAIRFFLVSTAKTEEERYEYFNWTDPQIRKMIKAERATCLFDITSEQFSKFKNDIETLEIILSRIQTDTRFTPIQLSAIYHVIQTIDKSNTTLIDNIVNYCDKWAGKVSDKSELTLWEQHINDKDYKDEVIRKRNDYFERSIEELKGFSNSYFIEPKVIGPRKVTLKTRKQVWKNWSNHDNETANCWTCFKLIKKTKWECGHIVPHSGGGSDEIENLIVQCKQCNRSQGAENAYEYKKRINPDEIML